MPVLGLFHLLIAIGFAVHAHRTGRPQFWMFILIFVPIVGSIAYVLFELLPEMANSRRARRVTSSIGDLVDPDREWRQRAIAAQRTDAVGAKLALAEEYERKSMWNEAIATYRAAATGLFADDPAVLTGLARSELEAGNQRAAMETLDRLRAAHPDATMSAAHLLYARALEADGRGNEAAKEYVALLAYNSNVEAKVRLGLLLMKQGEPKKARVFFEDAIQMANARHIGVTDAERDWLKVAKANLT